MHLGAYRHVLAVPGVRSVEALGFLVRVPMFAAWVALTLHIVVTLGRSYGEAGLVSAAFTVAIAVSAPWRGRLLDRVGLRRTVAPSVVVQMLAWAVIPFLPYAALLPVVLLAGLFIVPTFSVLRQALLAVLPEQQRRTGLSLDSVLTEVSFMVGPALGVWAATTWDTRWVLVVLQLASVTGAAGLLVTDPPLRSDATDGDGSDGQPGDGPAYRPGRLGWVTPGVLAVLGASVAATVVLAGTDVAIIAALRATGEQGAIGWVMALWGAGSMFGGLVYGAWHRSVSVFWLLGGLAATTLPVALAPSIWPFAVLVFVCGVLCAPTITATVDHLSRLVHERSRGEALGWHGSAMTTGQALGAPLAGFAIDHGGWQWGFVSVSLVGLVAAVAAGAAGLWLGGPSARSLAIARR